MLKNCDSFADKQVCFVDLLDKLIHFTIPIVIVKQTLKRIDSTSVISANASGAVKTLKMPRNLKLLSANGNKDAEILFETNF
jgi:hypothetical protein